MQETENGKPKPSPAIHGALAVTEWVAWGAGILLLTAFFTVLFLRSRAAKADLATFDQKRESQHPRSPAAKLAEPRDLDFSLWTESRVKAYNESLASDKREPMAVLEIPRLKLRAAVLPGTDEVSLNRGLGHIEGTPEPGLPGNVGIAGHRDGIFRCLKDITPGDRMRVLTLDSEVQYIVAETSIVTPEEVAVLAPTSQSALTLVTCYPFYYSGSAPKRFIVRAYRSPAVDTK